MKPADVKPQDFDTDHPRVSYVKDGVGHDIACDFIAVCDGFHGVSRASVKLRDDRHSSGSIVRLARILSETPPVSNELIYKQPRQGIRALHHPLDASQPLLRAMQPRRSSDQCRRKVLDELKRRLDREAVDNLVTGLPSKSSIAPLRSFVASRCGSGGCFLPATPRISCRRPRQGLNLAASDVALSLAGVARILRRELFRGIDGYSRSAGAGLEAVALFLVDDRDVALGSDTEGFWRTDPAGELGLSRELEAASASLSEIMSGCRIRNVRNFRAVGRSCRRFDFTSP